MSNKSTGVDNIKSSKRIVHWIMVAAFLMLLITGLPLVVPGLSGLAASSWSRLIHRTAAVVLVGTPVVYALTNSRAAWQWLREAAFWNTTTSPNPDTWQRIHKSFVAFGFVLFVLTGILQWFLKGIVPSEMFRFSLMIHDVAFFSAIVVLLYHIYHEFDWWLWKKRYCRQCSFAYCADVCPTEAINSSSDGTIERYPLKCNNCRLCIDDCRHNLYYKKAAQSSQIKSEVR